MRTLRQELNEKFVEVYFLSKSIAIYEKEVNSLQALLGGMKIQQEKGNISLMEISRLESMLFSLRKEKRTGSSKPLPTWKTSARTKILISAIIPVRFGTRRNLN